MVEDVPEKALRLNGNLRKGLQRRLDAGRREVRSVKIPWLGQGAFVCAVAKPMFANLIAVSLLLQIKLVVVARQICCCKPHGMGKVHLYVLLQIDLTPPSPCRGCRNTSSVDAFPGTGFFWERGEISSQ